MTATVLRSVHPLPHMPRQRFVLPDQPGDLICSIPVLNRNLPEDYNLSSDHSHVVRHWPSEIAGFECSGVSASRFEGFGYSPVGFGGGHGVDGSAAGDSRARSGR